jgi:hypothetical protein
METNADVSYLVTGFRADSCDDIVTQRRHPGG